MQIGQPVAQAGLHPAKGFNACAVACVVGCLASPQFACDAVNVQRILIAFCNRLIEMEASNYIRWISSNDILCFVDYVHDA